MADSLSFAELQASLRPEWGAATTAQGNGAAVCDWRWISAPRVALLSTHQQVLGGPSGQTYQGCRFPCDDAYRLELMAQGKAIGQALAAEGAQERYVVDFIARRLAGRWDVQAIELNPRQGCTTHPHLALSAITAPASAAVPRRPPRCLPPPRSNC